MYQQLTLVNKEIFVVENKKTVRNNLEITEIFDQYFRKNLEKLSLKI